GLAVVDLSHRGVVTVTGPDRLTWLHSMTTQHLTGLAPRTSRESLVLSPKGHIEHALHLVDDGETTWITVEPGSAPALVAWLDSMRFMLRVEVADVTADWAVLGEPIGAESAPGEPLAWVDPWPSLVGDTAAYGPVEGHPGEGRAWRELVVARPALEAAVGDRPLAGTWAAEALRVMAWRPRLGAETDHRTIAHEVDWLRTAVHLHKGCYRGQETIARVHNLGRPPRRLVFLHLDGSGHVLPDAGAPVRFGDREVGRITTVARHHEDGPVALAVIKRSIPEDVDLLVGETAASQTVVVSG
ncbi:MAG TPA: folate-binding protein, partial [Ornithinibacter sp.]|nr:folate-binding protein [Ornithinibacter sp.]